MSDAPTRTKPNGDATTDSLPRNNTSSSPPSECSDVSVSYEAVSAASALVGECLLDGSFSTPRSTRTSPRRRSTKASPPKPPPDEKETEGWYQSGMSWWNQRRLRQQREALQAQVEAQKLVLLQASQDMQRKAEEKKHRSTTLDDNVVFQTMSGNPSTTTTTMTASTEPPPSSKESFFSIHPSHTGAGLSVDLRLPSPPASSKRKEEEDWIPTVRLADEPPTEQFCPYILTPDQFQQLAVQALPPAISYAKWKRLYSLARDGDNFGTFLKKVQHESHTLMVLRTTKNYIFGGYADSCWESQPHGGSIFYGSAQACLWRFVDSLNVYKWTGANRYIQLCDVSHKMVAFGGGGGSFGLCVEQDFQRGSTGPCDTFGNEPLCPDENFEIVDVEVFGFVLGQF